MPKTLRDCKSGEILPFLQNPSSPIEDLIEGMHIVDSRYTEAITQNPTFQRWVTSRREAVEWYFSHPRNQNRLSIPFETTVLINPYISAKSFRDWYRSQTMFDEALARKIVQAPACPLDVLGDVARGMSLNPDILEMIRKRVADKVHGIEQFFSQA